MNTNTSARAEQHPQARVPPKRYADTKTREASVRTAAAKRRAHDDELVRQAMDLLETVARDLHLRIGRRVELDELRGYAHEAIVHTLAAFDESRGVPFRAFARWRVRGAMIDGLRRDSGLPRPMARHLRTAKAGDLYVEPSSRDQPSGESALDEALTKVAVARAALADACAASMGACDGSTYAPEELIARKQVRAALERALADLGTEGVLLRRHYFMDEELQQAAATIGYSKSWGSRLHDRGIKSLAHRVPELRDALVA